jgi:hypothetical protein
VPQPHLLDVLMYTCVGCAPLKAHPSPGFKDHGLNGRALPPQGLSLAVLRTRSE